MSETPSGPTSGEALRRRAEQLARDARHRGLDSSDADPRALLHELQVHHIELELQNEELRRAYDQLQASRARYVELYDGAPVGYLTVDAYGVVAKANRAVEALCGRPEAALVGRPFSDLVDASSQDELYGHRRQLAATGKAQTFELRLAREGAPRWVLLECNVADATGPAGACRLTLTDITALKEARELAQNAALDMERRVVERTAEVIRSEQMLRSEIALRVDSEADLSRSEALLRAILDTAADAILVADEHRTIRLFNRAAERMFGWSAGEVIGHGIDLLVAPGDRGWFERALSTRDGLETLTGRELVGVRKDGGFLPLAVSLSALEVDRSRRFTAILHDLTQRRQLEEQFRRAQKMEAIGRLASGIAHDFNNLLMGILGSCTLARRSLSADTGAARLVDEISGAAERGATLSRQLLNFGRRTPGIVAKPIRLNDVVHSTVGLLRPLLGEDITLVVEACGSGAPILGDASSLEQILLNLAVNARDAMKGGGRLRIATTEVELSEPRQARDRRLPPGRYVALDVEDAGCGIPPEIRDRVFEPFYTTKPPGEGTGLGLYSAYGVVEQLGGAIDFVSEVGRGTTFTVLFPRVESVAEEPPEPAPVAVAPVAAVHPGPRTVLLVEDEPLIQFTLEVMLTSQGYTVLTADSFQEALARAAAHPGDLDLLLSDMVLPGGYGNDLAAALQARLPALRVLFMSAFPHDLLVQQGRIAASASTLEKPFSEPALLAAVEAALALPAASPPVPDGTA